MLTDGHRSALLSVRGARPLLASSIVARLPLAMFSIALLVHTQRLTGSFAIAGLATSAYALCGAASAPALGRLVDRHGQTGVLAGGALLTAASLICLGLLPAGTPPAVLVALAAAAGAATPPLAGCVRTLLPKIAAEPSDVSGLFALESTVLELTFVFGPPLALGLGAVWSTGGALVVSGLVMVAGTAAFALQPASRMWQPAEVSTGRATGSLRSTALRVLLAIDLGTGIVFGATEVGVTATAKHLATAAAAAPILGLWGIGSLLAGVLATRIGGARTARALVALVLALAVSHGALLLATASLPIMGGLILLAGATIAPTSATVYVLVDHNAPAGSQTEAFSWMAAAASTGAALGAAIAGVLAQRAGPMAVFAFAGAAGVATAAIAMRHIRHLASDPLPAVSPPARTASRSSSTIAIRQGIRWSSRSSLRRIICQVIRCRDGRIRRRRGPRGAVRPDHASGDRRGAPALTGPRTVDVGLRRALPARPGCGPQPAGAGRADGL